MRQFVLQKTRCKFTCISVFAEQIDIGRRPVLLVFVQRKQEDTHVILKSVNIP